MAAEFTLEQFKEWIEENFQNNTSRSIGEIDLRDGLAKMADFVFDTNSSTFIQESLGQVSQLKGLAETAVVNAEGKRLATEILYNLSIANKTATEVLKNQAQLLLDSALTANNPLGEWDASTNTPALTVTPGSVHVVGSFYRITKAGTAPFSGSNFTSGVTVLPLGALLVKKSATQWFYAPSTDVGLEKSLIQDNTIESVAIKALGYGQRNLTLPHGVERYNSDGSASSTGNTVQIKNLDNSISLTGYTDVATDSIISILTTSLSSAGLKKLSAFGTVLAFKSTNPHFGVGYMAGAERITYQYRKDGQVSRSVDGINSVLMAADAGRAYIVGDIIGVELSELLGVPVLKIYKNGNPTTIVHVFTKFPNGNVLIGMRGSLDIKYTVSTEQAGDIDIKSQQAKTDAIANTTAAAAFIQAQINDVMADSINLLPPVFVADTYYRNSDGTIVSVVGWKRSPQFAVTPGLQITISGIDTEFPGTEFDINGVRIKSIAAPTDSAHTYKTLTFTPSATTRFLGLNINSPTRPDCALTAQVQIGAIAKPYEIYGSKSLKFDKIKGSTSMLATMNDLAVIPKVYPEIFLSYDPAGYSDGQAGSTPNQPIFYVYVKYSRTSDYYARYRVAKLLNSLIRADIYKITGCDLYRYVDGVMVDQGKNLLTSAETEFVWKEGLNVNATADFTGSYHGDEIAQECLFYVDSLKLSAAQLSEGFTLMPANNFWYIQKSEMYQTEATGESALGTWDVAANTPALTADASAIAAGKFYVAAVAGNTSFAGTNFASGQAISKGDMLIKNGPNWTWRPKVLRCYHQKKTSFGDGGFHTFNRVTWASICDVWLCYFGLATVSLAQSEVAYSENLNYETMTATANPGVERFNEIGTREINYYHSANKLGCKVSSRITKAVNGSTDNTASYDAGCLMVVWDVSNYSKYYRRLRQKITAIGEKWEGECTVKHFKG